MLLISQTLIKAFGDLRVSVDPTVRIADLQDSILSGLLFPLHCYLFSLHFSHIDLMTSFQVLQTYP